MKWPFKPVRRRDFIKKGIAGGVAVASLPLWKHFSYAIPPEDMFVPSSLNLDKETLERLLRLALESGGEFSEVYVEYCVDNAVSISEDKVDSASRGVDMGVGIRVLKGEKTGYAHSGDFSLDALEETARTAAMIASGKAQPQSMALSKKTIPSYYLVETSPDSVMPLEKAHFLMKVNSFTRGLEKDIKEVSVSFNDTTKKIVIANSEGNWVSDIQTLSDFFISINMSRNGKRGRGYSVKSGTLGYEHFTMEKAQELAKEALKKAIISLEAEDAPAGEFPAVFAKENGGIFFHEAIGHSLEADGIRKKTSAFWDKKGSKIASDIVSLADDGTVRGGRGSINIDDEGTPGQNTLLIENGTCVNFLFDKLNAKLMNAQSTGNGRRMSYKFYPIPRMTNTYLLPGRDDPEEIVKSVAYGVFVSGIGGGNVDPTTGRFVFEATESFLIEGGKITRPLKGLQLIDNGLEVLKNITMVGPDLVVGGAGTCGKSGQGKPCGDGNPTFKVSKITVGGAKIGKD